MRAPTVDLSASGLLALVAVLGVAGVALYVWQRGGLAAAAGGAVSGAVGAAGGVVGLPTPEQTTDDPRVVRWLIDNVDTLTASKWGTAGAFVKALMMDAGTGTPPTAGTPVSRVFGSSRLPTGYRMTGYGALLMPDAAVDAETRRLLDRYPGQQSQPMDGWGEPDGLPPYYAP